MAESFDTLRVLHVLASLGPTNAQYHEHCLPVLGERELVICSLLPASISPPPAIELFAGDGTRSGAFRALRDALGHAEYDVIHAHVPISAAALLTSMVVQRRSRSTCVFSLTNSYGSYRRRNRLLLYPIFAFFPHIVLCSESVRESLPAPLARLAGGKTSVVANGVDTARVRDVLATSTSTDASRRDPFTVISVSRLVPIKDPHAVLRAFQRSCQPGDRLIFVGDGPLRAEVAAEAARNGLHNRVTMAGLVNRDEVYRRIAAADVYVSASHGEGLPVAVLEAMTCGRPVILSDIPPHRELAEAVDVIPLVPPGDPEGFAREIARMRDRSEAERAEIGRKCREIVEERYGVATMHGSLSSVYARAARRMTETGSLVS